jgi:hypothetical protein
MTSLKRNLKVIQIDKHAAVLTNYNGRVIANDTNNALTDMKTNQLLQVTSQFYMIHRYEKLVVKYSFTFLIKFKSIRPINKMNREWGVYVINHSSHFNVHTCGKSSKIAEVMQENVDFKK